MIKELNAKQKQFGREFMIDRNTTAAYVRAGYSEKGAQSGGSRLMREPLMKEFVEELEAKAAERNDVDVDEVIKKLRESYDAATTEKHYAAAIRAAELLGKTVGAFIDVTQNVDTYDLPPEEGITNVCTQNGVLNEPAYKHGMEMLRLLGVPVSIDHIPEPTQDAPEAIH